MPEIGPFFKIGNRLLFDSCPISCGRHQADKIDNPIGHDELFSRYFRYADYIRYPRGRVIWDEANQRSIIYIDPCIDNCEAIEQIKTEFHLKEYIVEYDEHYRCENCLPAGFPDI